MDSIIIHDYSIGLSIIKYFLQNIILKTAVMETSPGNNEGKGFVFFRRGLFIFRSLCYIYSVLYLFERE